MNYSDWKKVYIDQKISLREWQNQRDNGKINGAINTAAEELVKKRRQQIKEAEDAFYATKTGSDFGFNRMKTSPEWRKEISHSNGDGKSEGRMINCQRCAVAHEARMRGYNVTARPSWGDDDPMRTVGGLLSVFEKPIEIRSRDKEINDVVKSVESVVKGFGEGARAFIVFDWKNSQQSGHIIVAECRGKGAVLFGDPQKKEFYTSRQLREAKPESIKIMRVDNLDFTDNVKRCCENRS